MLSKRLQKIYQQYQKAPKIILDTSLRSDEYINDLVTNCDVYLSLCNSEGVGLGACQAGLKGKIVVMTGYGGQIEYIKDACWVKYRLDVVKVPHGFVEWIQPPQRWAYPDLEHAVRYLQEIYADKTRYLVSSKQNIDYINQKFSYKNQGQILNQILGRNKSKTIVAHKK
jgi:glycosyltransferase involved in cell wall biosynthesis